MEVDLICISSNSCGICTLFKGTWRRLQQERPDWRYREFMIYSQADTRMMQQLYGVDRVPHIAITVDEVRVGEIVGTRRLRDLIAEVDSIVESNQSSGEIISEQ